MSLEGKAALKAEEVVQNADGTSNINEMWDALDHAFLPIDHHESKYRQFATIRWRHGKRITEYLDKLIHIFRKARPDTQVSFQNEDVKHCLLTGLPTEALGETKGYLDLSAVEIAPKYYLIHSQRKALGMINMVEAEITLFVVKDKHVGCDEYDEYEHICTYKDGNHQNRFKDETCTYCNKNEHTETVCFTKRDNDKQTKIA